MALLLCMELAPVICAQQPAATQTGTPATAPSTTPDANPSTNPAAAPAGSEPASPGTPASPECPGGNCDLPQPRHITIATPAPAPGPWPLQDRIAWAANLLLLLIAYVGVLLGISLLRKIERQSRSTEKAADAAAESAKAALQFAQNQAQAQAQAERPWILVTPEPTYGVPNAFTVVAANRGRSPARIVAMSDAITVAPDDSQLPAVPAFKSDPDDQRVPVTLLPGESVGIKSFRREDVNTICPSPEDLRRVEDWDARIFLYGKIVYHELIANGKEQAYETLWCCWYIHGRQKSGMVPAGPRAYSQHT